MHTPPESRSTACLTTLRVPNASQLVQALLKQPHLPAYVQQMDTPVLNNLIQHVGKEDSQELLVLTSANQIREIIALDVWESDGPGIAESFSPSKFLEWVYIWQDMGDLFLTEKLHELGSDLFSAALLEYAVVVESGPSWRSRQRGCVRKLWRATP